MTSTLGVAAVIALTTACAAPPKAPAGNIYDVVATDYAFKAPQTVPAGRVSFRFVNNGKVPHELNVAVLKKGVSIDDYVKTVRSRTQSVRPLIEGPAGVLFAEPRQASVSLLSLDVEEGSTLAVICIFSDSAGEPQHYEMGMYTTVAGAKSIADAPVPQQPTDTIIGTDYAFQYPRELVAGRHTFVFKNAGKMRHEVSIELLKKGMTLTQLLEAEKAGKDVESFLDKGIGVMHVYGGQSTKGQLSFEVEPGREYAIACYFQDDDKSPLHYKLGMYGSMQGVTALTSAPK